MSEEKPIEPTNAELSELCSKLYQLVVMNAVDIEKLQTELAEIKRKSAVQRCADSEN